ncbi:ABC transporter permease [Xaviernesmea oryzae]|uniref:Peptide/nickel transport system permease protein n=1 Tax=Xaviernesmea oryzae TaxID=464029 RepID=A0A1X7FWM8_9HYPH|nr:ABC transporter permease [Xaviernesmea oryzae]SMF59933.1 peptide/nickel transport system permease protein [Xaviernesmea oryzae]
MRVSSKFGSIAGIIGVSLIVLLIAVALFGPLLGLASPTANNLMARLAPPSFNTTKGLHLFGTDQLGRDVLSRTIHGARVTLTIGATAVLLGGAIGIVIGLVAGYYGRWVDAVLMRIVDVQLSIPLSLLALLVVGTIGPSLQNLIFVLALTSWVQYARVVRGQVLVVREREYIQSAHAIGLGDVRIIFQHILPNVLSAALVIATIELARVIILEAALSFLGLGVQPPSPSWGRMLAEGRSYMSSAPWIAIFPGAAIFITALSVNLTGDWLRDLLDPKVT